MLRVELNKKTDNPFYGMRSCLELYQNASKGTVSFPLLDSSWREVQNDPDARKMFFCLLFSIGDITARQHNIFKKKVDSGGNAQRQAFLTCLDWMKSRNYPQFRRFMFSYLIDEYVSFDALFMNRVKTIKKKAKVENVSTYLTGSEEYLNDLADFATEVIKGSNPSRKYFLAKFLTRPRLSKRRGHKKMLPETRKNMLAKQTFLRILSEKAGFPFVENPHNINFTGYYSWRKQYIGDLESVMFTSGKVREFDKEEFKEWLNKVPSQARYRIRCRVLGKDNKPKDKWGKIGEWFLEWENFKETKQEEQRVLEEKVRQGTASQDDQAKLKEVKKEAKVTVGANNFTQMFKEIVTGTVDKIKIQPFLDKVNLPYNTLVFVDDSGSMNGSSFGGVSAFDFATFIATICLMKNPDDVGRSLLGFFSAKARLFTIMESRAKVTNKLLNPTIKASSEPLIDPDKHFLDNLKRIREFSRSIQTSQYTNIGAIPDCLYQQIGSDLTAKEQLMQFPVWTIISDGNWNQLPSPEASINDMMKKCENYFNFRPFIIAIDVASNSAAQVTRFSGIDNFMFIPPNPAQIEQLLTNFRDLDIMDIYTPLQSLYRSNRYELVRKETV